MSRLVYSTDRKKIVLLARAASFSDTDIMKKLLSGVGGSRKRKRLLLDWAAAFGMSPSELLRAAARVGLIPDDRMPSG